MTKVLVTGANGYIGVHVAAELIRCGHEVLASDLIFDNVDSEVKPVDVDIFSGSDTVFEDTCSPDVVIHLAWKDGFIHNSSAHMQNLSKHARFLTDMATGGCKKIAVMGSMHEIGYWEGAIDEYTPCNPLSQYGISKNALRQSMMLKAKEADFDLFWLRAYYIFGDDLRGSSIFSKIVTAAKEGKKEFPFTSGRNKYDFIHIDELARQIVAASTQEDVTGVINVCSGRPVSLADQVEAFIKDNGFDIELKYGAFPDRDYDSPGVWGDSTKINTILGEVE